MTGKALGPEGTAGAPLLWRDSQRRLPDAGLDDRQECGRQRKGRGSGESQGGHLWVRDQREEWAGPQVPLWGCWILSLRQKLLSSLPKPVTNYFSSYPRHFSDSSSKNKITYTTTVKGAQGTQAHLCKQKTEPSDCIPHPGEDSTTATPQTLPASLTSPRKRECLGCGRLRPYPNPGPFANLGSSNGAPRACIFKEPLSTLQKNDVCNIKIESPLAAICYYIFTGTLH